MAVLRPVARFPRQGRGPQTYHRALELDVEGLLDLLSGGKQDRRILAQRMQVKDRRMRYAIEEARRRGHLVIWADGYYRLAESRAEYELWLRAEVMSRIGKLAEQMKAMNETVARRWPEQQRLAI